MKWPEWWQWELEFTSHLLRRMEDRAFSEMDLREMLERARAYRPDIIVGRWVIETRHSGKEWLVIVEPDFEERRLIVVTAYRSGRAERPTASVKMKGRYLDVTFRNGKPFAAYLYLPRSDGEKSVRSAEAAPGILVDYGRSGRPIGLEITAPEQVSVLEVNAVLEKLGLEKALPGELAPLRAA